MNLSEVSTTQIAIVIAVAVLLVEGIDIWLFIHKRRTEKLRTQFGDAEYTRALKEGGGRRKAEAALDERAERVKGLHIRPLAPGIVGGLSSPGAKSRRGLSTVPEVP
jgi:hypothetical protein